MTKLVRQNVTWNMGQRNRTKTKSGNGGDSKKQERERGRGHVAGNEQMTKTGRQESNAIR